MSDPHRLKRPLLYVLVASVALAVVLGMVLVLRNTWGWFEVRVILSTITIGGASICGMASDVSRAHKGRNILPAAGMILTVVAAALILFGMWSDRQSDDYWKMTVSATIFAVAAAHACLISVGRLARRFRWVQMGAYQVVFGLAALLVVMLLWQIDTPRMFQIVAALAILDAGISIVVPILHRISRTDPTTERPLTLLDERSLAAIDGEIASLQRRIAELEELRSGIVQGA